MNAWQLALENLKTLPVNETKSCLSCGTVIIIDKQAHKVYCSYACKIADGNRRYKERLRAKRCSTSADF